MFPTDPGVIGDNPALLVVDAQQDFMDPDGALYCPCSSVEDTETVVENISSVVETARAADVPIIWTKESHRPDGSDYGTEWLNRDMIDHTVSGADGEQLVSGLDVTDDDLPPGEYMLYKRRYNCFYNTDLEHLLNTFEVDTLLITGVTTAVCVHYTAHGALERDYVFRVLEECTAESTDRIHEAALTILDYIQSDGVVSQSDVEAALEHYDGNETVERVKSTGRVVG
jgi:nicotinamidase-related amidase